MARKYIRYPPTSRSGKAVPAKCVRQVVLRWVHPHGEHRFRQAVQEVSSGRVDTVRIPVLMDGGFGAIVLSHTPGDVTVSGLPVYR